jgi:hypothetical protein
MSESLPTPWDAYPDLPTDESPSREAIKQFREWVNFLVLLSPDEFRSYERDHPAPTGWEQFYHWVAQLQDSKKYLEHYVRQKHQFEALVEKMWQSTSLK